MKTIDITRNQLNTPLDEVMEEAGVELHANLRRIFTDLDERMLPSEVVSGIHSVGYSEDGQNLVVMCDMADGRTCCVSVSPGDPIGIIIA